MVRKPISLKEWQDMFFSIYGEKDQRDYTKADLLLHLEEEAAKIDEAVRKENKEEMGMPLARLFRWLLSFCNSTKLDLEATVFEKYPAICPYCSRAENCLCITEEKKPLLWFKNPKGEVPLSLSEWQKLFARIYGRINRASWTIVIWLHFHEELGELSRALRMEREENLKEEVADTFAWFIAFCNKLNINLEELVWGVYSGKCDFCGQEKCFCPRI